jgi:hypothetical protein
LTFEAFYSTVLLLVHRYFFLLWIKDKISKERKYGGILFSQCTTLRLSAITGKASNADIKNN